MEFKPSLPTQQTYKCLLLGDSGVGKSTFLRRHATGQFEDQHVPTNGLQVYTLLLQTNYQAVALELWDVAGDERHAGLHNGYFFFARCAIIMFDLSDPQTAQSAAGWQRQLDQICGKQLPVVICGNKADLPRMTNELLYHPQEGIDYCELSVRAPWNLEAPLELLCRRLLHRNDMWLISQPVQVPLDDCTLDESALKREMEAVREKSKDFIPKIDLADNNKAKNCIFLN